MTRKAVLLWLGTPLAVFAALLPPFPSERALDAPQVPPLLPVCDSVSGLVGYEVQAVPGCFYGFSIGGGWQHGVDYEGNDAILLYSRHNFAPYGTADMLRVSTNRLWNLGPASGTPEFNDATLTLWSNVGVPAGLKIMPWLEAITQFDAIRIVKRSTADRFCLHFGQGDGRWDIRVAFQEGGLDFFSANGRTNASATAPGRKIARLDQHGNLWLSGIVKEKTLP